MKPIPIRSCLLAAAVAAAVTLAAEPAALRALFPRGADVFVEKPGLTRLDLPPEILAACKADLSDLRLFGNDGREIPFFVDSARPPGGAEVSRRGEAAILSVRREENRRETGPPVFREVYDVRLLEAAPPSGAWALSVAVSRPKFVARVALESIAADGSSSSLLRDGSLFRLAGAGGPERLRLEVPPFEGDRLRLTLESEEGAFLEPTLRFESGRRLAGAGRVAVPLEIVARRSGDGRTVLEAERARGLVPDLLRVVTTSGTFDRKVTIWDEGPGSVPSALGQGRVFRVRAVAPVEEIEIALGPPRGDRLRVEVEDGDSPALEGLAVEAVVRQPVVVFEAASAAAAAPAAVLRFGGHRAHAPRYDLAAFALAPGRVETGKRAEALTQLHDLAALPLARLGAIRPNLAYDDAPVLAFAMRPGAPLDTGTFSHRRTLRVEPSSEGLSRIRLTPADLAVLRGDLADLRIADGQGRQWPYLLERDSAHELLDLQAKGPERKGRASVYELVPCVAPLRLNRVLIDADAEYFDRPARLAARADAGDRVQIFEGRLARPVGDPRPVAVEVPGGVRANSLELTVEDGDDAPLALRSVRARSPVAEAFLAAPAGEYFLLLGSPDETAPQYELARVRDVVLGASSTTVASTELASNPDYSAGARFRGSKGLQSVALWSALIGAVVVLLILTLRLARR